MNKNLSVILPTLNESKNLESLIPEIVDIISSRDISNYEILIVDDGSVDDSNEVCNELNKEYGNIKFVKRKNSPSLPMSIYEGIELSINDNVAWLDADGSMPATALGNLIDHFFIDENLVVIGSRFVVGGGYKGVKDLNTSFFKAIKNVNNSSDSVFGMIFSMYFNKFLVRLFGSDIKDLTSGFIIGEKPLFSKSNFEKSNYGEYFVYLVADLLKNKVNIKEIGYICETRIHGESKTASNLFQLISRGIPYIKAAYNCRGAF